MSPLRGDEQIMALNNPAYSRNEAFSDKPQGSAQVSAAQLEQMYNQPPAYDPQAPVIERMTIDDTLMKSFAAFALLLVGAVVGWTTVDSMPSLWIGAALVGFVLAMVNIFKREPSPVLILAYALVQGVFLGGISAYYEAAYPGIVVQASVATLCVVGVTLALFASGKIRASAKATKVFMIAMISYLVFSLVNLGIMIFGGANASCIAVVDSSTIPRIAASASSGSPRWMAAATSPCNRTASGSA